MVNQLVSISGFICNGCGLYSVGNAIIGPEGDELLGLLDGLPPGLPGQLVQVGNTLCALYSPQPLPTQAADPLADPARFELVVSS